MLMGDPQHPQDTRPHSASMARRQEEPDTDQREKKENERSKRRTGDGAHLEEHPPGLLGTHRAPGDGPERQGLTPEQDKKT